MAAPSYTEDLTDIDLATATTNWAESSDAAWDDGGAPVADADYPYIQQGMAISQTCTKATIASLLANAGTGLTIPTDGAVLIWQGFASTMAMLSYASGGLRVMAGSGLADFYWWASGGNNRAPYPKALWQNVAVNPSVTTGRSTVGSPSGTWQYFGSAVALSVGIAKGNPHAVDAVRYGRCEAQFSNGSLADGYCTFAGYAAQDDGVNNRWGLIMPVQGGYLWKGLMTIGYNSVAADFQDSDVNVFVDDTTIVTSGFNKIDVRVSTTKLYWTRVSFRSLGTTSRGAFEMFAAADVRLDTCSFVGMGTFVFYSSAILTNTTWTGCGVITAPGCSMLGCNILVPVLTADTSALVWDANVDTSGKLDGMTFTKGSTAHHAITLGTTSPTTVTLKDITTVGFNASNSQNDSTIYVARTTGDVTINVTNGTGNFSYKSAGANVTIASDLTITFDGFEAGTEIRLYKVSDGSEVDGIETTPSTSWAAVVPASTAVNIVALKEGKVPIRMENKTYTVSQSVSLGQQTDRNFRNP